MLVTIDFETHAIQPRPKYPPEPVGVAIKELGRAPEYLAWGHISENNTTRAAVIERLSRYWQDPETHILCHNAAFDLAVAYEQLGLPELPWYRVEETMFLLFLDDPHAESLALKPSAERYLKMPPDEQDELHEWLWARRKELPSDVVKPARTKMGAFIAYAPASMVAPYAKGDVVRTEALYRLLMERIERNGMRDAYDRERRLMPILMENERIGLRVSLEDLQRDIPLLTAEMDRADDWLRDKLDAPGLSLDNDNDYAYALARAGLVPESAWKTTKTGRRSVAKTALPRSAYTDTEVHSVYGYRGKLATSLRVFLEPWLEQASETGGTIHPQWNQVRGEFGTRTGRPSMTKPNLLNVARSFDEDENVWTFPKEGSFRPLPIVRHYLLPDEGCYWLHRDFDGQELRAYANTERGSFFRLYRQNPKAKPHDHVRGEIERILGRPFSKIKTKNINFGRIYGAGLARIAEILDGDMAAAREISAVHDRAMPDLKIVQQELERIARRGEPIMTWGGRRYYVEPPKIIDGKRREFYYKLLNYHIQGSCADMTKEAIIRWHDHPERHPNARLLLTVYDEINISAPISDHERQMELLKHCMRSLEVDVPMLSKGAYGPAWGRYISSED